MSTTVNFSDVLVKVQTQRKKYSETIDAFYVDIEAHTEDIIECTTTEELWSYRDRLEEIRGSVYKLKRSAARNYAEIQDNYRDSLRVSMSKTKTANGLAYSEREAKYEMQNITEYKILNNMERIVEDLDRFSKYLEGRLAWVKDRQWWVQAKEKSNGA